MWYAIAYQGIRMLLHFIDLYLSFITNAILKNFSSKKILSVIPGDRVGLEARQINFMRLLVHICE